MKHISSIQKVLLPFIIFYFSIFTFELYAQPGALDPNFSIEGKEKTSYPDIFFGTEKIGLQLDGRIIVAGVSTSFTVTRYLPNGILDSSFGINGVSKTNFVGPLYSMSIQNDDKILLGGGTTFDALPSVIRLLPNGLIDSSFGVNGVYTVYDLGKGNAAGIAVDASGNILFGGSFTYFDDETYISYPYVVRLTPNGVLDKTFGNEGRISNEAIGIQCLIRSLALGRNGKIALAGDNAQGVSSSTNIFVALFTADGRIDSSFSENGYVNTRITSDGQTANDVYIKEDGKILVAGSSRISSFNGALPHILLVQYNPDGSLDESFGEGGAVEAVVFKKCYGNSMKIQQNGKIVVAGQCIKQLGDNDFVIARFQPDGRMDSTFGINGFVVTDFDGNEEALSVLIQKDGNIVAGGSPVPQFDESPDLLLARYIGDAVNDRPLITKIKRWIRRHILNFTDVNGTASYYVVEQQNSGAGFMPVARIAASKSNTYSYDLNNITTANTNANFRIKAVYADGVVAYSDAIQSSALQADTKVSISPNPASSIIHIALKQDALQDGTIYIYDAMGNLVKTQSFAKQTKISINISSLRKGHYRVVVNSNGIMAESNFLKE